MSTQQTLNTQHSDNVTGYDESGAGSGRQIVQRAYRRVELVSLPINVQAREGILREVCREAWRLGRVWRNHYSV